MEGALRPEVGVCAAFPKKMTNELTLKWWAGSGQLGMGRKSMAAEEVVYTDPEVGEFMVFLEL